MHVIMMLTKMPEDIEFEVSSAKLEMFSVLAWVLPSLCSLLTPNRLPKPSEELDDLVGD